MTPSYQTEPEPPKSLPQPKNRQKTYIIIGIVIVVVASVGFAWLLLHLPTEKGPGESGEVKLKVGNADFPESIYIRGYEPVDIKVGLENSGTEIANQTKITVTLTSNVDARVYTWTQGDIPPGGGAYETFSVNVDGSSRYIYVTISYDGKAQDTFNLLIT